MSSDPSSEQTPQSQTDSKTFAMIVIETEVGNITMMYDENSVMVLLHPTTTPFFKSKEVGVLDVEPLKDHFVSTTIMLLAVLEAYFAQDVTPPSGSSKTVDTP